VKLTDPLQARLGWNEPIPTKDGKAIRLIDLVTHTSGVRREAERALAPADDPFRTITKEAFIQNLQGAPLLFVPGTGALYSNFGFDLLAQALASCRQAVREAVARVGAETGRTGIDSVCSRCRAAKARDAGARFQRRSPPRCADGADDRRLRRPYSSANDILRWFSWHLDRFSPVASEMRLIDHAAYVPRDGLSPVFGLDESGRMDAMGLGWVIMMPTRTRRLVLQKAGGLQGTFSYMAFAPAHGVGAFVAINTFDFGAAQKMAPVVNDLIAALAPPP
jgi:D-alanyl-D-alanine-carboxypeptidase/D-alanyl-D-alanine-endopeptidase